MPEFFLRWLDSLPAGATDQMLLYLENKSAIVVVLEIRKALINNPT